MVVVPAGRMHADELETDETLVRRLLAVQFPQWAELPIEALPVGGTDNAIYRLGDGPTRGGTGALGTAIEPAAVTAAWDVALAAPDWDGPPVWIHGDLDARNLLVRDAQITGVVDWASACVGDPACDVKVAWAV